MENLRRIILGIALAVIWVGCADDAATQETTTSENEGGENESTEGTESSVEVEGEESIPSSPVEGEEGDESATEEGDETAGPQACASDADCPEATSACQIAYCDPAQNTCEVESLSEGSACEIGSGECVTAGTCLEGECVGEEGQTAVCNDQEECTQDSCEDGVCVNEPIPGCCKGAEDCIGDSPCMVGSCNEGVCEYEEAEDCCESDAECADDKPCTADVCVNGSCTNELKVDCCAADGDCNKAGECQTGVCDQETGSCSYVDVEDCCSTDADCDNSNPCIVNICNEQGSCVQDQTQIDPTCCNSDADCNTGDLDDEDVCTENTCDLESNTCNYEPVENCCVVGQGEMCNDENPCTDDVCQPNEEGGTDGAAGTCSNDGLANCCFENLEGELSSCDDGNKCIVGTCDLSLDEKFQDETGTYDVGECTYTNNTEDPDCCDENKQCDDGNPCTQNEVCEPITNTCTVEAVEACCLTAEDCGAPAACETFTCEGNACVANPIENCCEIDSDCVAQGPCYVGTCGEGVCTYAEEPLENCCDAPGTCDDGNPCTQDSCNIDAFQCLFSPIPNCLECEEGACDDKNPCTDEVCNDEGLCDITANQLCPTTDPICIMSNPGGSGGTCKLQLIAADESSIATAAEFVLAFDSTIGTYEDQSVSVNCPDDMGNDLCATDQTLQTGHSVLVTEESPGMLKVSITFADATVPMTSAIQTEDGSFTGNSSLFEFSLGLPNDVEDNSLSIYVMEPEFTVNGATVLDVMLDLDTFITMSAP